MTTVNTSRLPAKPRNKRLRYTGGMLAISAMSAIGGGFSTPSYWDLVNANPDTGEVLEQPYIRSQYPTLVDIKDGYMQVGTKRLAEISTSNILKLSNPDGTPTHFHATGDVVAYSIDETVYLPIATTSALGMVKAGDGLSVAADGTLNVTGGGGISGLVLGVATGNAVTSMSLSSDGKVITYNKETTFATASELSSHVNNSTIHVTSGDKSNWNDAYNQRHSHNNKSLLDVINQGLGTGYSPTFQYLYTDYDVRASRDVIAYSSIGSVTPPIATSTILGMVKAGTGVNIAADGTISASGGSGGVTSVTTTGAGNAYTTASISGSVLMLTKGITFATASELSSHVNNTTVHITSGERSTWNAKQDKLTAGTGITISNNIISATGGSGGVLAKVEDWGSSTTTVYYTYYSGLAIRTGYVGFSGTLAAGGNQVVTLWNVSSSVISCVASLRLPSSYSNLGLELITRDNGGGFFEVVLYNSSSVSASVSAVRAYYMAIMKA